MSQFTNQSNKIIADQNDRFRRGDPSIPGERLMTAGLAKTRRVLTIMLANEW